LIAFTWFRDFLQDINRITLGEVYVSGAVIGDDNKRGMYEVSLKMLGELHIEIYYLGSSFFMSGTTIRYGAVLLSA
jgi:hypothetical protein